MKIGIIGSGFDMLPLMSILNQYEHEVHFFIDWKCWPWGDKSSALVEERLEEGIKYLEDKVGVDILILPPFAELKVENRKQKVEIMPLFETYILDHVLKFSLVGKLGVLLESDGQKEQAEALIKSLVEKYNLTDNQKNTKNFKKEFPIWTKSVRMWNYFLTTYGRREPMVRKTLKHDLAYFSDAKIDSLISMSRGFLFYQKLIRQKLNRKKKRFHGLDVVKECFEKLIGSEDGKDGSGYSITLHYTDIPQPLLDQKKWMKVLSRGGEVEVGLVEIK